MSEETEAGCAVIEVDEHWRPVVYGSGRAREIAEERLAGLVSLFEGWLPHYPRPEFVWPLYADVAAEANRLAKESSR